MSRRRKRRKQNKSPQNLTVQQWVADAWSIPKSSSGETVTSKDMLGYPPAWHCINKIAGHVGYLPLNLYQRDPKSERTKKLAEAVPAYWLVKHQPNPAMMPLVFRQTIQGHAVWHGNGRAYIQRNNRGEPIGLWPLPPDRCSTVLVTIDDDAEAADIVNGKRVEKWHILRDDDGQNISIPDRNILHIMGLGYDGLQGYPILELAREWLGLAKSQNKAVGGNFKNGARPGFMLKAPPGAFKTQADAEAWLANFSAKHSGTENEGKAGLLTGGMEAQVLQMSARDSQWQEQRVFSRQDAAIWFQVEQMLGDDSSVSYRSLEEKNRAYVTNCLMRWLTTWEQECWAKLLTTAQRESMLYYFRFVTAALLRGSLLDRYQAYAIGKSSEFLSTNDIRESEDLDAIEGGDEYENPNVKTNESSGHKSTDKEPPTDNALRERLKALTLSRLGELQQVEANRVREAAKSASNFCEWVDTFYQPAGFTSRIETTWAVVGLSAVSAVDYAQESQRQLLDAAGACTQDNLAGEVSRIVAAWPERINQLAALAAGS